MKTLNIGLVGFGTVGSSVKNTIDKRKEEIKKQHNFEFNIKRIAVKRKDTERKISVPAELLSSVDDIIQNPEIDTVIELIGGKYPAKDIITRALRNKKNVITANKELLADYGDALISEARKNGCYFGFRAAMTGCYEVLDRLYYGGTVQSVIGVFNGTCNYILTEMERTNKDFGQILKQAQDLGYAEKDPSLDIDGIDTKYKLMAIARLVLAASLRRKNFYVEGIRGMDPQDSQFAKRLGYKIKLLGKIVREGEEADIRIHPALIPQEKILASLRGVENCIQINDSLKGEGSLVAAGAGGNPAAMAVFSDLIDTAREAKIHWPTVHKKISVKRINSIRCKYYMRFNAINQPGVLAKVASALARFDININKVIQEGEKIGAVVPIIIITAEALEGNIKKALRIIDSLPVIKEKTRLIRIEENVS